MNKRYLFIPLTIVTTCVLLNCGGEDENNPVRSQNITLAGHVYYQCLTTNPVNGVWVVLKVGANPVQRADSMITGPDGSFIFFDVEPGRIGFEVWKDPMIICINYFSPYYDESQNDIRLYFTTDSDCQ